MNRSKTKTTVILLVTFLLGGLLGGVVIGTITKERSDRREQLVRQGGLIEHIRHVIRPANEEEWSKVRPIVQRTGTRNREILRGAHDSLRRNLELMLEELETVLNDEQLERLKDEFRRMKHRRFEGPHHPRPHGPRRRGGSRGD